MSFLTAATCPPPRPVRRLKFTLSRRKLAYPLSSAPKIFRSLRPHLLSLSFSSSSCHWQTVDASDSTHPAEFGSGGSGGVSTGGSLDQARHRYKTAVTSVRASINSLCATSSQENIPVPKSDLSDIDRLEAHAASMRKLFLRRFSRVALNFY